MFVTDMFDIDTYDYNLPTELIAQRPLPRREDSKLMILLRKNGIMHHTTFADIASHLNADDLLVINNTKVMAARLFGNTSEISTDLQSV